MRKSKVLQMIIIGITKYIIILTILPFAWQKYISILHIFLADLSLEVWTMNNVTASGVMGGITRLYSGNLPVR